MKEQIFCLHGGLNPSIKTLDNIKQLDRFQEFHKKDQCVIYYGATLKKDWWGMSQRRAGYIFGHDISEQFNHTNKLIIISNLHQLMMNGYIWTNNNKLYYFFSTLLLL